MLEPPDIDLLALRLILRDQYGVAVGDLMFLPLGADPNSAVYRIATRDDTDYFLKLRSSDFNEASVTVPKYLSDTGMAQVIPPLMTRSGQLRASLPPFKLILYPFVEGQDAYARKLSDAQWIEFGSALKTFHAAQIPASLTHNTPRENFSPRWRASVRAYLARFHQEIFAEPMAAQLAAFLKSKSADVLRLVERAEQLADLLRRQPLEYILCHGDIHGWNLLVGDAGSLHLVDWDTLVFAPRERDLMFIGAGLGESGRAPAEEAALFYRGYSETNVNRAAIAYYRYERIIEDIAVYCDEVFLSDGGGEDRVQALEAVTSNFRPGGTVDRAEEAFRTG